MALDRSPDIRLALAAIFFFFGGGGGGGGGGGKEDGKGFIILAILEEGNPSNISRKLFWNRAIGLGRDVVKFSFSIFSFGGQFVQWNGTILTILLEGQPRNISLIFFINQATGLERDLLFLALAAIMFSGAETF